MSKVSFSRELLGTIRFIFDKTKSRTLNATQAYDISTSQIVLGSFPASANKKLLTKDLGEGVEEGFAVSGSAAVRFTAASGAGANGDDGTVLGRAVEPVLRGGTNPGSANVSFSAWAYGDDFDFKKRKQTGTSAGQASTAVFVGSAGRAELPNDDATKSNAAKDIYYGAFTVGTGLYREWQGKYAVLKVDLLTDNAILRVYNE